jgi:hypothetical protein
MFIKLGVAFVCCLLLLADSCETKSTGGQNSATPSAPQTASAPATSPASGNSNASAPGLDACALIERSEIAAVQGQEVQSVVPSSQMSDGLAISQCYYTIISADGSKNLSVHLEVMQNDLKDANRNAVRDLWQEKFQGAKDTKKKEKPKSVPSIGDGAFWVGNNKIGALYALKKDKLFRISIGGPDDEGAKIEKSKTLTEKALKRLS